MKIRKMLSAILCASLTASLMIGAAAPVMADEIANEDIKIGVSIWSSTDVLGSQCKRILDAAADALGYTPSAVSQLVAALEKDPGVPLSI